MKVLISFQENVQAIKKRRKKRKRKKKIIDNLDPQVWKDPKDFIDQSIYINAII